jgi:hypothetical protein
VALVANCNLLFDAAGVDKSVAAFSAAVYSTLSAILERFLLVEEDFARIEVPFLQGRVESASCSIWMGRELHCWLLLQRAWRRSWNNRDDHVADVRCCMAIKSKCMLHIL